MQKFGLVALVALLTLAGAETAHAQQDITVDWGLHDVGEVRMLITNQGYNNTRGTDYPGLLNIEYPPNSFIEHAGENGFFIGGIPRGGGESAGDTLVSVGVSFNSPDEFQGYSNAPWDTVWVAERSDTLDLPYYTVPYLDGSQYVPERDEGYVSLSDQDFITRLNDYNEANLAVSNHNPLYLDVIQTSYAWGSPPLDDIIVNTYSVTINAERAPSDDYRVEDVYIANFVDPAVGYRTGSNYSFFGGDDYVHYYEDRHTAIAFDSPGQEQSEAAPPMATKLIPPQDVSEDELTWSWLWGSRFADILDRDDAARYEQMQSGRIQDDQSEQLTNHINYAIMAGPLDLAMGDTLQFSVAMMFGEDEDEVLENERLVDRLVGQSFQVPRPPPPPEVNVTTSDGRIGLSWEESRDRVENYEDPYRADSVEQPFEGYRIWKSTQSKDGPWTLVGEYDVPDNQFSQNTGLEYTYSNTGLVNNVEYYYAVTAFSKRDTALNWPSQATSISATANTAIPGTPPPDEVGQAAVVPNPYRGDVRYQDYNPPWEKPPDTRERWLEQDRRLQFINLPQRSVIKIYTLDGTLVQTLRHNSATRGYEDWDMVSRAGQAIASGIYLYTVENLDTGNAQTGKFVVIK